MGLVPITGGNSEASGRWFGEHLGMFSSHFFVNLNISSSRISVLSSIFLRLLNFVLISLLYADFTVVQSTATLESL